VQLESAAPQLWGSAPQLAADVVAAVLASGGSGHLEQQRGMLEAAAELLEREVLGLPEGAAAEGAAAAQREALARAHGLVDGCRLLTRNGLPTGVGGWRARPWQRVLCSWLRRRGCCGSGGCGAGWRPWLTRPRCAALPAPLAAAALAAATPQECVRLVRQLLARAQRGGAKWGEAQWAALWEDLAAAQAAGLAGLDQAALLAEFCRWGCAAAPPAAAAPAAAAPHRQSSRAPGQPGRLAAGRAPTRATAP
jgi:hypothetical protein